MVALSASASLVSASVTSSRQGASSERTVRHASVFQRHLSAAKPTGVAEKVIGFLRSRHPHKTAEHVAAETGLTTDTVQKWIERGGLPNGFCMFVLLGTYGPDFAFAVMDHPPAWLSKAVREERLARLKAEIAHREAELALLEEVA